MLLKSFNLRKLQPDLKICFINLVSNDVIKIFQHLHGEGESVLGDESLVVALYTTVYYRRDYLFWFVGSFAEELRRRNRK